MANERRRKHPDMATRFAPNVGAVGTAILSLAGTTYKIYTDSGASTLANITDLSYVAINQTTSPLALDTLSMLPEFYGPDDGTDTLYARKADGTGPIWPLQAGNDARIDHIEEGALSFEDPRVGGIGDDSTDNLTAFANAKTLLQGSTYRKQLRFLPGRSYRVSDVVDLMAIDDLSIIGYGSQLVFTKAAATGAHFFRLGDFADGVRRKRIYVFGLTLTLNRAVSTSVTNSLMLGVRYADDVVIRDCKVLRSDVQGIYAYKTNQTRIESNVLGSQTDGGAERIGGDGIFTGEGDDFIISGNIIGNTKDDGIFHERPSGGRSKNVVIQGNTVSYVSVGAGIRAQSVDGLDISGNIIRKTGDPGIDVSEEGSFLGCINFGIEGNRIIEAGQHSGATGTAKDGITALGSAYGRIAENTIRNPRRIGIQVAKGAGDGYDIDVEQNRIIADTDGASSLDSYGIQMQNMSRSNIERNRIINSGDVGILVQNTLASDIFQIGVYDNFLDRIKKTGGVSTIRAIYFTNSGAGIITRSQMDGNRFQDRRAGPLTSYCYRVDAGNVVQIGPSNVWSDIPITDNAGGFFPHAAPVKAGAIADSDFAHTPPNGTIGIDSTNGRIYFRYGGAWHYANQDA